MKKIFTLVILFLVACDTERPTPKNDCIIVLVDLTDSLLATNELSIQSITSLFQVTSTDPLMGAIVNLVPITNLRFNKSYIITIPYADKYISNEVDRKREIDSFHKKLETMIDQIKSLPIGRNGSAVFENLSLQLNEIMNCTTCNTRRLIVISDLRQFSPLFNSYDSAQINHVKNDPEFFANFMDSNFTIPSSLKGVEIIFLNQPVSTTDDSIYFLLSDALRGYLENKGAKVSIKTHFNNSIHL